MSGGAGARHNAFAKPQSFQTQDSTGEFSSYSQDPNFFDSYTAPSPRRRQPGPQDVSPISPTEPRWVPPAARVHLQALQNCEPEHVEIGLSLAREGKLDHLKALQNFPVSVVMRWWKSLATHEDTGRASYQSPYSPLAPPSYRDSNGSSFQSSLDPRMSVASASSANTQYSSLSESSAINKAFPPRKSSSNYRQTPDIRLQRAVGESIESEPIPVTSEPITQQSRKPRPPSKPLPFPPGRKKYFCTVCEEGPWTRDSDWLLHEQTHHRQARWLCECGLEFPTERRFKSHHAKGHSCQDCDHAKDVIQISRAKKSLGCGFCCQYFHDLKARNSHIAEHYESGKTKEDWSHNTMILSLLQRPPLALAWKELLERRGHSSDGSTRELSWNPADSSSLIASLEYQEYGESIVVLLERLYGLGRQLPADSTLLAPPAPAGSIPKTPEAALNTAVQLTITPARTLSNPNPPTQSQPRLVVNQARRFPQLDLARPDSSVLGDTILPHESSTSIRRNVSAPHRNVTAQPSQSPSSLSLDLALDLPTGGFLDLDVDGGWEQLISFPDPPSGLASLHAFPAPTETSTRAIVKSSKSSQGDPPSIEIDPKEEVAATDEAMESFMSEAGIEPGTRISFMQID